MIEADQPECGGRLPKNFLTINLLKVNLWEWKPSVRISANLDTSCDVTSLSLPR